MEYDYIKYLSSEEVLTTIDKTTNEILNMDNNQLENKRQELTNEIDGEIFFPIRMWPTHLQEDFYKKPIPDTATFKLLLFFTCNGGPPTTLTEWILTSYGKDHKRIKKRHTQIKHKLSQLKDKKEIWYYHDLIHNKLLYLNKKEFQNSN